MNSRLAFGFDGGGTQTRAILIAADGRILGFGKAGSSNINIVGFETATDSLRAAAAQAWARSGQPRRTVEAAFLGLSGIEAAGKARELEALCVSEGLVAAGACLVGKDSEAALAGGLSGRPGLVLIAGTGSFCLGRDSRGAIHRCGGWGWLVDDVGGGSHLGREAIRAVLLASDGRAPESSLSLRLLDHAGVRTVGELTTWIYRQLPYASMLAELARLVIEEARRGDAVATAILRHGAEGLAGLVAQVAGRFKEAPELVLVGGLAQSGAPYQVFIEEALHASVPGIRLRDPELPPVVGAALRAFEHIGLLLDEPALIRLRATLPSAQSLS